MLFNKHTETIVKDVLLKKGYISFDEFKKRLSEGDPLAQFELESIIHQSMVEYAKELESYYTLEKEVQKYYTNENTD